MAFGVISTNRFQLPCLFFLLEGLMIWLNFGQYGPDSLYVYYPVILVGITLLVLVFPARILYHRSRQWWMLSNVSFSLVC